MGPHSHSSLLCGGNAAAVVVLIVVEVVGSGLGAWGVCLSWLSSYWANHWASGCPKLRGKRKMSQRRRKKKMSIWISSGPISLRTRAPQISMVHPLKVPFHPLRLLIDHVISVRETLSSYRKPFTGEASRPE